MRFSTRGLFGLIAFMAFALSAFKFGGIVSSLFVSLVAACALAAIIAALVASGARRAFSIGFLVPFIAYFGVHYFSDVDELNFFADDALPTTRAFKPLHQAIVWREFIDASSGEVLPDFDPHSPANANRVYRPVDHPNRETFVLTGHSLLALISSILGGVFAVYIRISEPGEP